MPLPRPTPRKLMHNRVIDCRGYERDDGLWDIEGHLTDAKTYTWEKRNGVTDLPAGQFAHDMWIRLTIDLNMVIHEAMAVTEASPYNGCGDFTHKFAKLKGLRIDRGWTKKIRNLIGGPYGCTHQWELLGRVAAAAYQSTNNARQNKFPRKPGDMPRTFNTCHMYTAESEETLRRWPDLYKGPKKAVESA
ncbi:MAG: DUF2889 domain-containing protein [Betaproteobacteria bacterium]|nr:DUF2889 domain-containing protein [Betaproteobacteria bacterium]